MTETGKFAYQPIFREHVKFPVSSKIERKYNTAFDALNEDYVLHFTALPEAMNSLSVLIPADIINKAEEGQHILLSENSLTIASETLKAAAEVPEIQFDAGAGNFEIYKKSCGKVKKVLQLFGVNSIIKELLLHKKNDIVSLSEIENLLRANDFAGLLPYVGAGEGLTPSFDDFISAVIFADRFFKTGLFKPEKKFFYEVSRHTTRQAAQQYFFADKGRLSRQFEQFCLDIYRSEPASADTARLLHWGHSSGTDLLCGFVFFASFL